MNKAIITCFFSLLTIISFSQNANEKILYVIDSIPVIENLEKGDDIHQEDVGDLATIKNKDSLLQLGYEKWDGVIYLFTKEYRSRSDSIRQIPSTKQMTRVNGVWMFHNSAYSGSFIDYYYSGKKKGEGVLKDGKLSGHRVLYYQNGNLSDEWNYTDGIVNGLNKEYYEDGSLKQKGMFASGKEEGIWQDYFPNGQVKMSSSYKNGELIDSAFTYYSTGKIKEKALIKNGKLIEDPSLVKINQFMDKSDESNKEGDTKAAIKYCTKVIEIDSTYAGAYFLRGTLELNDFKFDEAIADLDKALLYEPFMQAALSNRAFARIRKYQFASSRTLSKNNDVTVMASADKVSIPATEQEKICTDLHKAILLGAASNMIDGALADYCSVDSGQ